MAFTREELSEHEKKPQTQVDDKVSPFTGEKPAAPDAAAATGGDDTGSGDDPSGADNSQTDPDEAGDGVSGDEQVDSSTTTDADPSGETETTNGEQPDGEPVQARPRKGSAAERIQELVDERDGYRAYGEYAQEQIRARDARITELESQGTRPDAGKPAAEVKEEPDEPFPTLEDPDVNYDQAKLQVKTRGWAEKKAKKDATKLAAANPTKPNAGANDPKAVEQAFLGRVAAFAKTHEDWEPTVKTLPPLAAEAARVVILGDDGPEVLYYLGKHRKDAVRIAQLPQSEQLMELGVIRAQLRKDNVVLPPNNGEKPAANGGAAPKPGAKPQAKPKTPSGAPTPPTRVAGGGSPQTRDIQDPNLSMDEFAKRHREARVKGREASRAARGLR